MSAVQQTDVLIIGAGPTGLHLACQLERHGLDFVIIDKNEGPTPFSKAIGVHARTLEIYEQIGLAEAAVEQGTRAGKIDLLTGGEVRGKLDLSNAGDGLTPYPFVLMLEQSKNEALLYGYLQQHEREVQWNTGFESLMQTAVGVTALVRTAEGELRRIEAKYLVGCDGSRSPVRKALGMKFEGSTLERIFYVADVEINWDRPHDTLHVCLSAETFVIFFPLKGEKRYRIVGVLPDDYAGNEGEILYEEIERRIKQETQLDLDIPDVRWFSTYKVHSRHVESFSDGRCFLAGDAAHIHSPVGAQGMNTGIQDGYNLAWKLALVLNGEAREKVLESYNQERLENAKTLLQTTDRMFQFVAGSEGFVGFLRSNLLPPVAAAILSFDGVKRTLFPRLSQIGINYRDSPISMPDDLEDFTVSAGDRMPYFMVEMRSIYELLHAPTFHLLRFSNDKTSEAAFVAEAHEKFGDLTDVHTLEVTPHVTEIFGVAQPFHVLLRPDNYIALLSTDLSWGRLEDYLKTIISPTATA